MIISNASKFIVVQYHRKTPTAESFRSKNMFVNVSEKILPAFWHMCDKVMQLKRRLSKRRTRLQARMHTQGEVSDVHFSKLKQFLKIFPENTLVNCITQPFLFIETILKVSEKLLFSDFIEKYFLL